jgi:hypothetical protein
VRSKKTWSQSYDRELQRQCCKKFTTPRVRCLVRLEKNMFYSTLKPL